jgi:methylmalonyl-CoA mutase cobalamin-binding subunit
MPLEAVFDKVLIPALAQAELDAHRNKLDEGRHASVRQGIADIAESLMDRQRQDDAEDTAAQTVRDAKGIPERDAGSAATARRTLAQAGTISVLCVPARSESDAVVANMLGRLLERRGYGVTMPGTTSLVSEVAALASSSKADAIVISAVPPRAAINVRYMLNRLKQGRADAVILVGLWANTRDVTKAGLNDFDAKRVVTTLADAQDRLDELAAVNTLPAVAPVAEAPVAVAPVPGSFS